MKKILFVIVAVCVSYTVSAIEFTKLDKVPWPQYFTDIRFDQDKYELSYYDEYRQDEDFWRKHTIVFYYRNVSEPVTGIMKVDFGRGNIVYMYGWSKGDWTHEETYIAGKDGHRLELNTFCYTAQGRHIVNIRNEIAQCIAKGYGCLHIVIRGYEKSGEDSYISYEETENRFFNIGSYLNNYIDIDVSGFTRLELAAPHEAAFNSDVHLEAFVQGTRKTSYHLQQSEDMSSWKTVDAAILSAKNVKEGTQVNYDYTFNQNGMPAKHYYRMIVQDILTGHTDTTNIDSVSYFYNVTTDGYVLSKQPGDKLDFPAPHTCMEYRVVSDFPVQRKETASGIEFTIPACNIEIKEVKKQFLVRFLDADYTLLKADVVDCGDNATPPATPVMQGYTFKGWNRDITNVRGGFTAIAQYDMGDDYVFTSRMTGHKNELHPFAGFEGNGQVVMVGDSLVFSADVRTPAESTLSYQWAYRNAEGEWQWSDPMAVGTFTSANANQGLTRTFTKTVAVAYQYGYESAFQDGYAFRFRLYSAGAVIYSAPYEYELYYPVTINSMIEESDGGKEQLLIDSRYADVVTHSGTVPARYNDTIFVSRINGGNGACMDFARVNRPEAQYAVESGLDDNGNAWILCPGETETFNVTVTMKLIVFDGVYENGYPKQLDFTVEGFGKMNGYYGEVVNCGGSVKMPDDPQMEAAIFVGWESWNDSEYPDDAYAAVPAVESDILGFVPYNACVGIHHISCLDHPASLPDSLRPAGGYLLILLVIAFPTGSS